MNIIEEKAQDLIEQFEQLITDAEAEILNSELSEEDALAFSGGQTSETNELTNFALLHRVLVIGETSFFELAKKLIDKKILEVETKFRRAEMNYQMKMEKEAERARAERMKEEEARIREEREIEEALQYEKELKDLERKQALYEKLKNQEII